ncbi:Hypothetical protein GLP15_7 [Giardia lamblia P15]|uniref:Uncharacterized protein n=1 Tax=Giardia intestinalis (strain P15) TaxID=658858 RepID=E1EWF8_GIAIA|nr:Hypothetical protein GLP15_7 [Giardia lamblia P15]
MYVPAPVRKRQLTRLDACIAKHTLADANLTHQHVQIHCIPIDIKDRESLNRKLYDELRFLFTGTVCPEIREIYTRYFTRNDISIESRRERAWKHFLASRRAHNLPQIALEANGAFYILEDDPQGRITRLPASLQGKAQALVTRNKSSPESNLKPAKYEKYMVGIDESRYQIRNLSESAARRFGASTATSSIVVSAAEWRKLTERTEAHLMLSSANHDHSAASSSIFADCDLAYNCTPTPGPTFNVLERYRSPDNFDRDLARGAQKDEKSKEPTEWYEIYKSDILTVIKNIYRKNM